MEEYKILEILELVINFLTGHEKEIKYPNKIMENHITNRRTEIKTLIKPDHYLNKTFVLCPITRHFT